MSNDYKVRILHEYKELLQKIDKLDDFIKSGKPELLKLSDVSTLLLKMQRKHMIQYSWVLALRIVNEGMTLSLDDVKRMRPERSFTHFHGEVFCLLSVFTRFLSVGSGETEEEAERNAYIGVHSTLNEYLKENLSDFSLYDAY